MLIDHIGAVLFTGWLFPDYGVLRLIGRIALPLYAYMIAQGCKRTKNINKYLLRLGLFALISEIPFDLTFWHYLGESFGDVDYLRNTNVFYTLFFGAFGIAIYESLKTKKRPWIALLPLPLIPAGIFCARLGFSVNWRVVMAAGFAAYCAAAFCISRVLAEADDGAKSSLPGKAASLAAAFAAALPVVMLASLLDSDYGMYAVIFILIFYFANPDNRITRTIVMLGFVAFENAYPYFGSLLPNVPGSHMMPTDNLNDFWFSLAAVVIVFLYNGKRGPKVKWSFYIFYPAHIAVLGVIFFTLTR
jgi:hypothetical protein